MNSDDKSQSNLPAMMGAIVRASLSTAPFTGGLASLWADWDTSRRFVRVEETIRELGIHLSRVKSFESTNFGDAEMHLLEDTLQRVSREHREEKRAQFAQLLASNWVNHDRAFDERLLFQRALDEFDAIHIQILRALSRAHAEGKETVTANDLCSIIFGENPSEEFKFGVFVPALNKVAAEMGFVRRRGQNDGRILIGINPDGLVFHVDCLLMSQGQRFLDSVFPKKADPG
jgi:hypothetical protein